MDIIRRMAKEWDRNWKEFAYLMNNTHVDFYSDGNITTYEIRQPANRQGCPEHIQYFRDKKKNITKIHFGKNKNNPSRQIIQAPKRIMAEDEEFDEEDEEYEES